MLAASPLTALVVDDNFYNRDLCNLALKHIGYEVVEAEDGVQALDRLSEKPFDLLVLDLEMPRMDGSGVLQRLAAQVRAKLSIIVMTANPHMVTDEISSHADFVIIKPIDVAAFTQLAQRLQASKRASKSV